MYYGFDIGGSKIALGIFDANLREVWHKRVPTPVDDYQQLLTVIGDLTHEADLYCGMQGAVGIGVPGLVNEDGSVFTANIPAAMGKPLPEDLGRLLHRSIRVDNDANCFTLAEAWHDEFRQYPMVLGVILGTGVGGGLVVERKVLSGRNAITGEFGHFRLPITALEVLGHDIPRVLCGCGHNGCVENYISGRGFEWMYAHFYQQPLSAQQIIAQYQVGEWKAVAHVDRFLEVLAVCLSDLLTIIDPHLVVFGGGLSNFSMIYQELPKRLPKHLLRVAKLPRIEQARYGDAGGVRGAALLNVADNHRYLQVLE